MQRNLNRVKLMNSLIRKFGYTSYLEIGCGRGRTFRRIQAANKVGVDPHRGGTLRMTSDDFFHVNRQKFDLVFVDGLHHCEQVLRDVEHACRWLSPHGCVVIHDCLPKKPEHQFRHPVEPKAAWTGDVWKAIVRLRQEPQRDVAVLDADWGLADFEIDTIPCQVLSQSKPSSSQIWVKNVSRHSVDGGDLMRLIIFLMCA